MPNPLSERKREISQILARQSNVSVTDDHWLEMTEKLFQQMVAASAPASLSMDDVEAMTHLCGRIAKKFYDTLCAGGQATLARDARKFGSGYPDDYAAPPTPAPPEPDPAPAPDRGAP